MPDRQQPGEVSILYGHDKGATAFQQEKLSLADLVPVLTVRIYDLFILELAIFKI